MVGGIVHTMRTFSAARRELGIETLDEQEEHVQGMMVAGAAFGGLLVFVVVVIVVVVWASPGR